MMRVRIDHEPVVVVTAITIITTVVVVVMMIVVHWLVFYITSGRCCGISFLFDATVSNRLLLMVLV